MAITGIKHCTNGKCGLSGLIERSIQLIHSGCLGIGCNPFEMSTYFKTCKCGVRQGPVGTFTC